MFDSLTHNADAETSRLKPVVAFYYLSVLICFAMFRFLQEFDVTGSCITSCNNSFLTMISLITML